MAGQRKDREERFEETGLTTQARKALIADLRFNQRLTERQIAARVGMSNAGVHWICKELEGKKRNQARMDMCESCWQDFPVSKLNHEGLCATCR